MASVNPEKMFSVKGMVVAITGGGTGMRTPNAFADGGAAKVYIVGRRKEKLDEAAQHAPDIIVPLVGDVTSKDSLVQLSEQIEKDTGYVNLLICNSGTMEPAIGVKTTDAPVAEYRKKCLERSPEEWNTTFSTNSTAVAFTTFAFLELLDAGNRKGNCKGRQSQVLVTTSIAGYLRVPALVGAYPASKAAATHLIKGMAGAMVPYSIRVNGLAPGLFPSDLSADLISRFGVTTEDPSAEGSVDKALIPAGRMGSMDDIVGTVLYMASAAAAYMNGNITVLDGGRIAQLPGTY
ncbi:hypothetical protein LTR53_004982 [Teratosphaeriaceae sp. CCFEE 6253]|nr:hypothetical protein LTR53_004982 [Teratosphaeriaceae sp. CCFEE 6253]